MVLARIGPSAYRLELPVAWRIHPVFHVSLLRAFDGSGVGRFPSSDPIILGDAGEFEVDRIVRHRERGRGRGRVSEFLVLWKGFDLSSATWEPEGNLTNAPERLAEYWASVKPP